MNTTQRILFLITCGLLPIIGCSGPAAFDRDAVRKRIDEANVKWVEGVKKGDAVALSQLYLENAYLLPPGEPLVKGREGIRENYEKGFKSGMKFTDVSVTTLEVNGGGDLAYEVGSFAMTLEVPGAPAPMTLHGKYAAVWKVQADKSVKYQVDIWNMDPPPAQ
jgi:ketosteroid isomerase-like protein